MCELRPVVNFTKKAYSGLTEYITANASPEHVEVVLGLLKDGLREVCHFDPEAKYPPELIKLRSEQRTERCAREGVSIYEKYTKPRVKKLREIYPGVPVRILNRSEKFLQDNYSTMEENTLDMEES